MDCVFQEVSQRLVNLSAQLHALQVRFKPTPSESYLNLYQSLFRILVSLPAYVINPAQVVCFGPKLPVIHESLFSQGVVIQQDSVMELCVREGGASLSRSARSLSREGTGEVGTAGELALLQRQHSLLQEELVRLRGAEGRLKDSEKVRAQLEKQLRDLKSNGAALAESMGSSQVLL